jgi:hypothetical protein
MTNGQATACAAYGGVYRAVCLEVLPDQARVQIPQLFATETVTVFEFAGPRPSVGDAGWVFFEAELAERPVWAGSESKGGGGGVAAYPPYWADSVNVSVNDVTGGVLDVVLLDGTVKAAYDGWVEVIVSGGYAGLGTDVVNVRQGIMCPDFVDPTGQAWISFGWMASVPPSTWDQIGDCQLNIPVVKDQIITLFWRGNWAPSSGLCSFRSMATVKFYSSDLLGDGTGISGGNGTAHGIPPGGSTGQVLAKESGSDYDTQWVTAAGLVSSYRHIQTTPAATWTVVHNLGYYPNITVVDSTGRAVVGEVTYTSVNVVTLTFSAAFGGEAYAS